MLAYLKSTLCYVQFLKCATSLITHDTAGSIFHALIQLPMQSRFRFVNMSIPSRSRPFAQQRHNSHTSNQKEHRYTNPQHTRFHKPTMQPVPRQHLVNPDPREDPCAHCIQGTDRDERRRVTAVESVEHADTDGHPDGRDEREASCHEVP